MSGLPPSPLIESALATATEAHAGQVRNGARGMPYIEHPKAVAGLLAEHGWEEQVLAAALLHDVLEDSELTEAELRARFGAELADLVALLSDDEAIESWPERKTEHRERMRAAGAGALAIYGADKLTNVRTLRAALAEQGESVAGEFKVPLESKLQAWEADRELLAERAPELPFLDGFGAELSALRAELAAAAPRGGT